MNHLLYYLSLLIVFSPLVAGVVSGLFSKQLGRSGVHCLTTASVGVALLAAIILAFYVIPADIVLTHTLYIWGISGPFSFKIGFLIDNLTAVMMLTVCFVSFVVHIYSIAYMHDDNGYQRFFSYISLFTFAMLMLVTANNFLQLFFGWEGVGLISYLLIGFWFKKESANYGSLKAFLVNRVGDFGFILGLAAILDIYGSLDYSSVFAMTPLFLHKMIVIWPGIHCSVISLICLLLFIGAMGKSAQMPLHVWLPESMEGPTPISALIHAATMVTAGIYMVARLSPMFEYSSAVLSFILIIGASTALYTGLVAIVQDDIKRVVAYSTLSQLGYMTAALGASAFSAGIFHLMTHAMFKALLFLAAGSVILAMHHEQDMRKMGNLRAKLPLTYIAFLIGALALAAIPPFSGFYSKDSIIAAVHLSTIFGAQYSYICLVLGAFVTGLYIFRAFFMTFHGKNNIPAHLQGHVKEGNFCVKFPLIALSIPAVCLGFLLISAILYQKPGLLGSAIFVLPSRNVLQIMSTHFHGPFAMFIDAFHSLTFWVAATGIFTAWFAYVLKPGLPAQLSKYCHFIYYILIKKYGFDDFNDWFFVRGTQKLARFCYEVADFRILDQGIVNGVGHCLMRLSAAIRKLQTGYIYHYVFAMLFGFILLLVMFVFR